MHGHIMQLANKLWRQIRIVGYVSLHFFVCWCHYLRSRSNINFIWKERIFMPSEHHIIFYNEIAVRYQKFMNSSECILTCSLWPWGKYTTRLPTGMYTSAPQQLGTTECLQRVARRWGLGTFWNSSTLIWFLQWQIEELHHRIEPHTLSVQRHLGSITIHACSILKTGCSSRQGWMVCRNLWPSDHDG
jgi:hypothetical protein